MNTLRFDRSSRVSHVPRPSVTRSRAFPHNAVGATRFGAFAGGASAGTASGAARFANEAVAAVAAVAAAEAWREL